MQPQRIHGAGLGLRRDFLTQALESPCPIADFLEIAPENWLGLGGYLGDSLSRITESYPVICHGLSLSLGSPDPLDRAFLHELKGFLKQHQIALYSEHLSYCSVKGHLYDLLPIPFTAAAVRYVVDRIQQVQELLGQTIAIENVSYYAAPSSELTEAEFLQQILSQSGCQLLLDINNIYVNSINQGYNASEFLRSMPAQHIAYIHVAGHDQEHEQLLIDTHGTPVIEPVWQLLQQAYQHFGVLPTLLERDFNIPPLNELVLEVDQIRQLQQQAG